MKRFFQVVVSFVLCYAVYLSGFNTYARASVINSVAPIPIVKQAKSNWCWAASAEMFGKGVLSSSTRTQYTIARSVKGSEVNERATYLECLKACRYASSNVKPLILTADQPGFNEIVKRVAKGEGIFTVLAKEGTNLEHAVVVSATQFIDGSSGTEYNIDYIDPYYGISYHCSYDSFCNGHCQNMKFSRMIYTK